MIQTLERLNLSDNNLTGEGLGTLYKSYEKLKQLNLSNNAIRNPDCIKFLTKIKGLITLDLSANPLTDIVNYR